MNKTILMSCSVIALTFPQLSLAQDADDGGYFDLGEIIIWAQHRLENVIDIPIGISVISEDDIKRRQATKLEDVFTLAPNTSLNATRGGAEATSISIGGMTTTAFGADPSVSVYVDGVYVGADSGFNAQMSDISSIEILRGPQGTVSGRNAIGGAVNVYSGSPNFDGNETEVGLTFGSNGLVRARLTNNTVINDRAALRFSLYREYSDGWISNAATGEDVDSLDAITGRLKFAYKVNDSWDMELALDYQKDQGRKYGFGPVATVHANGINTPLPFNEEVTNSGIAITNTWQTGIGELKSITAWRNSEIDMRPGTYAPFASDLRDATRDYSQFSQEFRLNGSSGALDWTVGLFAFKSDDDRHEALSFAMGLPANLLFPGQPALPVGYEEASDASTSITSVALYADGTYAINDRLDVVGGLRISYDKKTIAYNHGNNAGFPFTLFALQQNLNQTVSETNISPRLGLVYALNDNANLYGMISSGYKPAGFNPSFAGGPDLSYGSEKAINYEIGAKGVSNDGRLAWSAAAFYVNWTDQQVFSLNTLTGILSIDNAPKSRSYGAELALDAQITDSLRLGFGLGYNDATFVDYQTSQIGDASGNQQPLSSKYSASLSAQYRTALANELELTVNADYTWRSKLYFDAENLVPQSAYGLANVSVGIAKNNWSASVYVKNLLDEDYFRSGANLATQGGLLGYPGEERTFGIQFTAKF